MRLFATLNEKNLGEVDGTIFYSGLKEPVHIRLLIDSGAVRTCLLQDDVVRLGIDWNPLEECNYCFITANGVVKPKKMIDVQISISIIPDGNGKDFLLPLNFPEFPIIPPRKLSERDRKLLRNLRVRQRPISILGMDILQMFRHWEWTANTLILTV